MKKYLYIVFVFSLFLSSCGSHEIKGGIGTYPVKQNSEGVSYELFYIEGMPCMRIGRSFGDNQTWAYDGVTCDWSKWSGNK